MTGRNLFADEGDTHWMRRANCLGMNGNEFFPPSGSNASGGVMKVCGACAVRMDCLEYALRNHIDQGIWGGYSERGRRRLRRTRRTA